MPTIYKQAVAAKVKTCLSDPEWASLLVETLSKMHQGFWERAYIDFFLQKGGWHEANYDLEDAYAFMLLHWMLMSGSLLCCDLRIGELPGPDKDTKGNLEKLNRGLDDLVPTNLGWEKPIFSATVWGGTQDEDGHLSWRPSLAFEEFCEGLHSKTVFVMSRRANLEIGSQSGAKTIIQLAHGQALARWPYGSETIRIFIESPQGTEKRTSDFPLRYGDEKGKRHNGAAGKNESRRTRLVGPQPSLFSLET